MWEVARILCGSHLYGTNLPGSDRDYKIVYVPTGKQILLQQENVLTPKEMSSAIERLKKDAGIEGEPDVEFLSLRKYLKLLCQGQTDALDMFFAPQEFYVGDPGPEWYAVKLNGSRWISKNSASFVSYCRDQAGKYVIKTDRYEAVKRAVDFFTHVPDDMTQKIESIETLGFLVNSSEHIELVNRRTAHGANLPHLSVCQTLVPVTATCKVALNTFNHKLSAYGERVKAAADMDAKDWKSLYHAVRVAEEALELLRTGKLTLPRPEKGLLRAIRLGKIPFEKISTRIEKNLQVVEEAVRESTLPEQPDWNYADTLVETFYRTSVCRQ